MNDEPLIARNAWEQSYERAENFILYPKEEVVKFLNRFVRKRTEMDGFRDILDFSAPVRGLDYGCGIGRQTVLLREFGIEAHGVDISETAITAARSLARAFRQEDTASRFSVLTGGSLPFADGYFDVAIADSVLDSMPFSLARAALWELGRITKRYAYLSLISGNDGKHGREFDGEETVETAHEHGTTQSYFNWTKIQALVVGTDWSVVWCSLMTEESVLTNAVSRRYHLVLSKDQKA